MHDSVKNQIETILGKRPIATHRLSGGMIGAVYRVGLTGGDQIVAKIAPDPDGKLDIEGYMLSYLARHSDAPVPDVIYSTPTLLLMTFVDGASRITPDVERHAAHVIASLHTVTWDSVRS